MSKVGRWSTTPASNNALPPDGWPEGQLPSTVNNCAREMMAQLRTLAGDIQFVDLDSSPTYVSSTTFTLPGDTTALYEYGRRVKLFDSTTLYGTIADVSLSANTSVTVRLDSGLLSTSLSSIAVASLSTARPSMPTFVQQPLLMNGAMDCWQRGETFLPVSGVSMATADRWRFYHVSGATVGVNHYTRANSVANVPTFTQLGAIASGCLGVIVSPADTNITAAKLAELYYPMEGLDFRRIAHKPTALSFWVYSTQTGTYSFCASNAAGSYRYVAEFTILQASTWQRIVIPIPAPAENAPWNYDTSVGMYFIIVLAAGANFRTGVAGSWSAVGERATTNQVNFLGTINNLFLLTALKLEEGTAATPFTLPDYSQDLHRCRRYYENVPMTSRTNAANVYDYFSFKQEKRGTPTLTVVTGTLNGGTVANGLLPTLAFRMETAATGGFPTDAAIGADAELT